MLIYFFAEFSCVVALWGFRRSYQLFGWSVYVGADISTNIYFLIRKSDVTLLTDLVTPHQVHDIVLALLLSVILKSLFPYLILNQDENSLFLVDLFL